jgi:hypothetical protein
LKADPAEKVNLKHKLRRRKILRGYHEYDAAGAVKATATTKPGPVGDAFLSKNESFIFAEPGYNPKLELLQLWRHQLLRLLR